MREAVIIQNSIYDNDLCHERVKVLFIILLRQNSKGLIAMHEKTLFTKKNTILPRGVASFPTNFEDEEVLVFKVLFVRILNKNSNSTCFSLEYFALFIGVFQNTSSKIWKFTKNTKLKLKIQNAKVQKKYARHQQLLFGKITGLKNVIITSIFVSIFSKLANSFYRTPPVDCFCQELRFSVMTSNWPVFDVTRANYSLYS